MEIRSVPSSGRPGAQLGHHIIFTFDRNGTGIIFRKSIGKIRWKDPKSWIFFFGRGHTLYILYTYIFIYCTLTYICNYIV